MNDSGKDLATLKRQYLPSTADHSSEADELLARAFENDGLEKYACRNDIQFGKQLRAHFRGW